MGPLFWLSCRESPPWATAWLAPTVAPEVSLFHCRRSLGGLQGGISAHTCMTLEIVINMTVWRPKIEMWWSGLFLWLINIAWCLHSVFSACSWGILGIYSRSYRSVGLHGMKGHFSDLRVGQLICILCILLKQIKQASNCNSFAAR